MTRLGIVQNLLLFLLCMAAIGAVVSVIANAYTTTITHHESAKCPFSVPMINKYSMQSGIMNNILAG